MAANPKQERLVIADLRGGRNQTDPPMALPFNQAVEAINVDWQDATLARKRGGAVVVALTGGTAMDDVQATLIRHVPGNSETAAELWAFDADLDLNKRLTGGTAWANVTFADAIATDAYAVVGASLNGKLFLAFDSAVDRLHVYDPNLATPQVRRVNFATPGAPTAANTGAGAYAAVLRYYRVRWLQTATIGGATVIVRRSEPGASVSFTPSGAGTHARVTQPTAAGEQETHWEVEVSIDNSAWYLLAGRGTGVAGSNLEIAIATTTYDDNTTATAASYATGAIADVAGYYARFPSVRYLLSDGNRLLGTGSWESSGADSAGKNSRIWFTPVLGSADRADDERVMNTTTQKNWVDLNENDGGANTALGGPVNGVPYAFKYRQVWKLRPTGDVTTPYLPRKIRDDIGCVAHKSIALGEDAIGRPALYFLSHRGPYRITHDGDVQYLGRDNEDIWRALNLGATTVVAHSVFHPDKHQWWLWISTGSNNIPDTKMMLDVQRAWPDENGQIRGGWAEHTSSSAAAACSCLFSNTLGASMSRDLKPHIGRATGTLIWKCDTADLDDGGTDFQAFVKTRPILTTDALGRKFGLGEPYLLAAALSNVTLTMTIDRDFGAETTTGTQVLTAAGSETRVFKKFEGLEMSEADVLQIQIGDGAAQEGQWTLDSLIFQKLPQEDR
mgnify:CR=1 FL=1